MSEKRVEGGAGPAIAAHSKDGSVPGATPASSATGRDPARTSSISEAASGVAGQAREAARQLGASVTDAAATTRQSVAEGGSRAADQTAMFVQEHPIVALALTGAACLAVGILLGRR
jgi:ElaB/YqjD/DUF883 family membrane-anchored ribosome-binding protein